jgi:hypothetical protein
VHSAQNRKNRPKSGSACPSRNAPRFLGRNLGLGQKRTRPPGRGAGPVEGSCPSASDGCPSIPGEQNPPGRRFWPKTLTHSLSLSHSPQYEAEREATAAAAARAGQREVVAPPQGPLPVYAFARRWARHRQAAVRRCPWARAPMT